MCLFSLSLLGKPFQSYVDFYKVQGNSMKLHFVTFLTILPLFSFQNLQSYLPRLPPPPPPHILYLPVFLFQVLEDFFHLSSPHCYFDLWMCSLYHTAFSIKFHLAKTLLRRILVASFLYQPDHVLYMQYISFLCFFFQGQFSLFIWSCQQILKK